VSWQDDLGYIREVGPDEPKFNAAVKRVWDRLEKTTPLGDAAREASEWISAETSGFGHGGEVRDRVDAALAPLDEEGWPTPAPLPEDYWETAE
jgi:hypothetical protein